MERPETEREDGRPNLYGRVWARNAFGGAVEINIARVKTEHALDHDDVPTDEKIVDGDALAAVSAVGATDGGIVTALVPLDRVVGTAGLLRERFGKDLFGGDDRFRIASQEPWMGGVEIAPRDRRWLAMKVTGHDGREAESFVLPAEIEFMFGAFVRSLEIDSGNAEIEFEFEGTFKTSIDGRIVSSEALLRRNMAFAAALLEVDGSFHDSDMLRWASANFMFEALHWNDCEPGSPLEAERDHFIGLARKWNDLDHGSGTEFEVPSDDAGKPHWPPAMRRWIRENADMDLVQAAPLADHKNAGMREDGAGG